MPDQTGAKDKVDIYGKRILIIGSGIDLSGRKMGKDIDDGRWDVVIRLNKYYGMEIDIGHRTDIVFTRWSRWLEEDKFKFFPRHIIEEAKEIIIMNQYLGVAQSEVEITKQEIGVESVSIGAMAVAYCLHRGAREVNLIGYGFNGYEFSKEKRYSENSGYYRGYKDNNPAYNWDKERQYYLNQNKVRFL